MKFYLFILSILIILLKTGNVLSDNNIFNVNNIEINKKSLKNKENLVNKAFKKGFKDLIKKLLLEEDFKKLSTSNLKQIKELISYYQIIDTDKKDDDKILVNIFFDKDKLHNFFYQRNILYSDLENTEIMFFPLLVKDKQFFIYSENYFFENWNKETNNELIQFNLPVENIENIQKIKQYENNIYRLNISDFFKEYNVDNLVFASIEIENNFAKIYLNTIIQGKKINKNLLVKQNDLNQINFYKKIIKITKNKTKDLIKSQNLIDVRTPSFLNVRIKLEKEDHLVKFNRRLKNIDLIDEIYVRQINKDFVLIKIKYLGKIGKIIKKLKEQNMSLIMTKEGKLGDYYNLMQQLIFKFPFKTKYYDEDYYVSTNNFSAYKLIESWPNWPDKWVNIFGPSGCGKTHLSNILKKKN